MKRPLAELVLEHTTHLEAALDGPTGDRRREVEILLAHVLGLADRTRLYTDDVEPSPDALRRFKELVVRRGLGEPVAYLTGRCEFYGLTLHVGPEVLIPRPETEHVVEVCLQLLADVSNPSIVEIGVGSGAIAIALLSERPDARCLATDISAAALGIAAANAERLDVSDRLHLVRADLMPPGHDATVDLVVSNPPYVAADDILSRGVREYEPASALFADANGRSTTDRIVDAAPGWIRPGGGLVLEVGAGQADAVTERMERAGFVEITRTRDLASIERVISGRRPG